jgi:hypothetical protein
MSCGKCGRTPAATTLDWMEKDHMSNSESRSVREDRELSETELGQITGGVHEAKAGSWLGTNKSVVDIPPPKSN